MQPLIPGVIKEDPANAYVVGMADISNTTLHSHLRELITGLVDDGTWPHLKYLGVIQNIEADTLRCLVRRTSAFSSKPQNLYQGLLYTANSGYSVDTSVSPARRGTISSGFTPDPSDIALRDGHMLFQYLGSNGDTAPGANAPFMGRYDDAGLFSRVGYTHSPTGTPSTDRSGYAMMWTNVGVFGDAPTDTPYNSPEFQCIGRDNSSTIRRCKNQLEDTVAGTRTGSWSWSYGADATIHHLGVNSGGQPVNLLQNNARLCAWGMTDGQLNSTQTNLLRQRLQIYLTTRGAI